MPFLDLEFSKSSCSRALAPHAVLLLNALYAETVPFYHVYSERCEELLRYWALVFCWQLWLIMLNLIAVHLVCKLFTAYCIFFLAPLLCLSAPDKKG